MVESGLSAIGKEVTQLGLVVGPQTLRFSDRNLLTQQSSVVSFVYDAVDNFVQIFETVAAEGHFDTFVVEDLARFATSLALVAQARMLYAERVHKARREHSCEGSVLGVILSGLEIAVNGTVLHCARPRGDTNRLRVAVMFSGGKDSCYSVWLVQRQAWDIAKLVTVRPQATDSWMFHYPNVEWTGLQADAMGLQLALVSSPCDELEGLEETLRVMKRDEGVEGLVTGAVASDYQKSRFDSLCERVGLKSFSPLWHKNPGVLVDDLISAGFRIVMSGVAASGLDEAWLGKELTSVEWGRLKELSERHGLHLSGEGGEYETFVIDAPYFSKSISMLESERVWDGQSGRWVIKKSSLGN